MFSQNLESLQSSFLTKKDILKYVSEGEIFSLVFGFIPQELDRVRSPFRNDSNPNCYFEEYRGKLRFKDFGNYETYKGLSIGNMDCFDAVMIYYKLPNFSKTLEFIYSKLIEGKNRTTIEQKKSTIFTDEPRKQINISSRDFNLQDKAFWYDKYQITKNQLIEDGVFPINKFSITSTTGIRYFNTYTPSYAFTQFDSGNIKIYKPYEDNFRFVSTCTKDDIGGLRFLPESGELLVISKSYKDYRVLRNQGITNIWFQNEGMIPSLKIILPILNRFTRVVIFFDNDEPGIKAGEKVKTIFNSYINNKTFTVRLPERLLPLGITDPSDLIEKYGRQELMKFLNTI